MHICWRCCVLASILFHCEWSNQLQCPFHVPLAVPARSPCASCRVFIFWQSWQCLHQYQPIHCCSEEELHLSVPWWQCRSARILLNNFGGVNMWSSFSMTPPLMDSSFQISQKCWLSLGPGWCTWAIHWGWGGIGCCVQDLIQQLFRLCSAYWVKNGCDGCCGEALFVGFLCRREAT